MNTVQLFTSFRNIPYFKNKTLYPAVCVQQYFKKSSKAGSSSSSSSSSSESDSDLSDSDQPKPETPDPKAKNEEALIKLNSLLKKIIQEDVVVNQSKLELARPINKRVKKGKAEAVKQESEEMKMESAVKDVAQEIGGDVKQTESELLQKLQSPVDNSNNIYADLNEIVKGMKIDREKVSMEKTRADQVRSILQRVKSEAEPVGHQQTKTKKSQQLRQRFEQTIQPINLFGSSPLGIFTNKADLKEGPQNKTWQTLHERDLKLAVTHPPANYFQQMILWTEQGKLWKFPIDNEQGLDEEKQVYFAEHVFLEQHLEPWCPPKGPIRHFMELVCVGLSKNHYLSVKAKKEHIEWFKNYFEDKKKILQDVGAFQRETDQKHIT